MSKFIQRWLEIFKPYLADISDPAIRDVATIAVPLIGAFIMVWLISMPFGLVSEIIEAVVKIAAVPAG